MSEHLRTFGQLLDAFGEACLLDGRHGGIWLDRAGELRAEIDRRIAAIHADPARSLTPQMVMNILHGKSL